MNVLAIFCGCCIVFRNLKDSREIEHANCVLSSKVYNENKGGFNVAYFKYKFEIELQHCINTFESYFNQELTFPTHKFHSCAQENQPI